MDARDCVFFMWNPFLFAHCYFLSPSQLIDIDSEGYLSLMDDGGEVREDIKIDEKDDLGKEIKVNIPS